MKRASLLAALLTFVIMGLLPAHSTVSADRKGRRPAARTAPETIDTAAVNAPNLREPVGPHAAAAPVVRAQVLLDRAGFSSGEIDGAYGRNLREAIVGYQKSRGLAAGGVVDQPTWETLDRETVPAMVEYTVTQEDVAGPFVKVPDDMMEKAKLPGLGYQSPLEAIAEKFHASPALLVRLNSRKAFDRPGEVLIVPNVLTAAPGKADSIVVSASRRTVAALDASGRILTQYPATIGSEHDPLPAGAWKVEGIRWNPEFFYNPELFWDADPRHSKTKLAAGPNSPVGLVWIDLSKPHYGIHGTSEPSTIGRTQSHGCIRLTNWDAAKLAQMVGPGTKAVLEP